MSLKTDLVARLQALHARRAELVTQTQAQIADIDTRIAVLSTLIQSWDTTTPDVLWTALHAAGLRVKVDA